MRSRENIEEEFPDFDLSAADLRPLELPEFDTDLYDAVKSDPDTWALIESAMRASESPATTASVIVLCVPCDHKWVAVHELRSDQRPAMSP